MPTFCRHNRFIERCPICSKTLPGSSPEGGGSSRGRAGGAGSSARRAGAGRSSASPRAAGGTRRPRGEGLHVRHEGRAQDDGYRSELLPGLRASADAVRLSEEIAFSSGRLLALAAAPWGLYGEVRSLADSALEQATWTCFLISYLSPLQDGDPFAGIRLALGSEPEELDDLDGIPLGPRTSHDPARGLETVRAYRNWVEHSGGSQARAFLGDPAWSAERRFDRLFERLALPGFGRMGRYDLLVTLGALSLYELRADSLHLLGARGQSSGDLTTLATKRLFAIGEEIHLERRAAALAEAIAVPIQALDLAFANWASPQRATLGCPAGCSDPGALERARAALGL
ncbi:MAG: hypothetical protein ACLQMH_11470 [Solirubrobacteraceae bacterium]